MLLLIFLALAVPGDDTISVDVVDVVACVAGESTSSRFLVSSSVICSSAIVAKLARALFACDPMMI